MFVVYKYDVKKAKRERSLHCITYVIKGIEPQYSLIRFQELT